MDKKVYEFISKQSDPTKGGVNDPIVEWRICKWTGEEFPVFQLQKIIEERMGVTYQQNISPSSMFRLLCMFRNERHLYKNASAKSGKSLVTMYSPESGVKVYDMKEFWTEDFLSTKQSIPTSLDEIIQTLATLSAQVPKLAKINDRSENAEYANYVGDSQNIYLSYCVYYDSQDVYYSRYVIPGRDIFDSFHVWRSDLCYECVNVFDTYGSFFCNNLNNCQNCYYSVNLENCNYCIFCNNLKDKKYCIYNKQYSKDEFDRWFHDFRSIMKTYTGLQSYLSQYQQVQASAVYKSIHQLNCDKCFGNDLVDCHNSVLTFDSAGIVDSCNVRGGPGIENSLNMIGGRASYVINSGRVGASSLQENSSNVIGSYNTYTSHDIVHCQDLIGCSHMLFCCGLKNKEYCILNKQFSKQEREALSTVIIQQMKLAGMYGQPLSHELSSFPYNDTIANDFFPIKYLVMRDKTTLINPNGEGSVTVLQPERFISDAILDLGGQEKIKIKRRTRDSEINIPEHFQKIGAKDLPDSIDDVDDAILEQIIICEATGRPFRIIAPELNFYRTYGLPLPRKHYDVRHQQRRLLKSQRNLYLRTCDKCGIEMLSVYKQESEFKVYCEQCYNKEIY